MQEGAQRKGVSARELLNPRLRRSSGERGRHGRHGEHDGIAAGTSQLSRSQGGVSPIFL
jgi:hypothetical protein